MIKKKPHESYPVESGDFIRGNDYSPAAVAVILNSDRDKIPRELEMLVRAGAETGAALSGFVQTPNIGFEKMICNIVANPNIRYLVLAGPESAGHLTGEALKALFDNGVDDKKAIVGTEALHAVLYNIPVEYITRFREQVELIDLQFNQDPEIIKKAVWATIQEEPVLFEGKEIFDRGAWPDEPLAKEMVWQVTQPWNASPGSEETKAKERAEKLIEMLKERNRIETGH